jgi:hypothetical protein
VVGFWRIPLGPFKGGIRHSSSGCFALHLVKNAFMPAGIAEDSNTGFSPAPACSSVLVNAWGQSFTKRGLFSHFILLPYSTNGALIVISM